MNPFSNLPPLDLTTDRLEYRKPTESFSEDAQQWVTYLYNNLYKLGPVSYHWGYMLQVSITRGRYSYIALYTPTGETVFRTVQDKGYQSLTVYRTLYLEFLELVRHDNT